MSEEMTVPNHPHADQRNWQPGDDDNELPDDDVSNGISNRLQSAVNGAVRTLARLKALTYFSDEQIAEFFIGQNVKAEEVSFLMAFLDGVADKMKKQEQQRETRKCAECGEPLDLPGIYSYRADAIYCEGGKCRQAAYRKRKRVTANPPDTTVEPSRRDGSSFVQNELAVTPR